MVQSKRAVFTSAPVENAGWHGLVVLVVLVVPIVIGIVVVVVPITIGIIDLFNNLLPDTRYLISDT